MVEMRPPTGRVSPDYWRRLMVACFARGDIDYALGSLVQIARALGALGMLPSLILFDPRNRFSFNPLSHLGFALETIDHRLSASRK